MFGRRFFGNSYYGPRYWGNGSDTPAVFVAPQADHTLVLKRRIRMLRVPRRVKMVRVN